MDSNGKETEKPLEKITKEECSLNKKGQFRTNAHSMLTERDPNDIDEAVRSYFTDLAIYRNTR